MKFSPRSLLWLLCLSLVSCVPGQVPGWTRASLPLQNETSKYLKTREAVQSKRQCANAKVIDTEVIDIYLERWTLDSCGTMAKYQVRFIPTRDNLYINAEEEK